jgi:hypothetical protein
MTAGACKCGPSPEGTSLLFPKEDDHFMTAIAAKSLSAAGKPASVMIEKSAPSQPHNEAHFAIRTLARH